MNYVATNGRTLTHRTMIGEFGSTYIEVTGTYHTVTVMSRVDGYEVMDDGTHHATLEDALEHIAESMA